MEIKELVVKISADISQLKSKLSDAKRAAMQTGDNIESEITSKAEKAASQIGYAIGSAVRGTNKALGGMAKEIGNTFVKLGQTLGKLGKKVFDMFTGAFVFGVLSKQIGDLQKKISDYMNSNEQLSSSMSKLKGAFLNAIAPLAESFIPILDKAVQKITVLINTFGKLTAKLTSSTKNTIEQAKALEQIGKAGKSAGFDELNTLSGTEESAADFSNTSETVESLEGPLDKIGNIIAGLFETIGDTWKEIKPGLKEFIKSIIDTTAALMPLVKSILPKVANIISKILEKLAPAVTKITEGLSPVLDKILDIVLDFVGTVVEALQPVIDVLADTVLPLVTEVLDILSPLLKEIFDLVSAILTPVLAIIKPLLELVVNILRPILALLNPIITLLTSTIKIITALIGPVLKLIAPLLDLLNIILTPILDVITGIINFILGPITAALEWVANVISDLLSNRFEPLLRFFEKLRTALNRCLDIWKTVFGAMKDVVKKAFNEIKGFFNTMLNGIEKFLNGFVKAINALIQAVNKMSFKVPDWVPGLGGKSFGLNIKEVREISIPRLATGGIVQRPITAEIGEAGKEAVLPLESNTGWMDRLADIMAQKLINNQDTKLVLNVDGNQLGWTTIKQINAITKKTGNLQLSLS